MHVSLRLLFLPTSQTWFHHSILCLQIWPHSRRRSLCHPVLSGSDQILLCKLLSFLLRGNLQQSYKLFPAFDKSCSVYYYTGYRGETQILKNIWDDPELHNLSELRFSCALGWRCLVGDIYLYTLRAQPCIFFIEQWYVGHYFHRVQVFC